MWGASSSGTGVYQWTGSSWNSLPNPPNLRTDRVFVVNSNAVYAYASAGAGQYLFQWNFNSGTWTSIPLAPNAGDIYATQYVGKDGSLWSYSFEDSSSNDYLYQYVDGSWVGTSDGYKISVIVIAKDATKLVLTYGLSGPLFIYEALKALGFICGHWVCAILTVSTAVTICKIIGKLIWHSGMQLPGVIEIIGAEAAAAEAALAIEEAVAYTIILVLSAAIIALVCQCSWQDIWGK